MAQNHRFWRSVNNFIPLVAWLDNYPKHINLSDKHGIIEVPYSHTNYFFHRDVLKDLSMPYFEENLKANGIERENMDRAFTEKIVVAGHKLFINLDMVVGHVANISITKNFYKRWNSL